MNSTDVRVNNGIDENMSDAELAVEITRLELRIAEANGDQEEVARLEARMAREKPLS